MTTFQGETGRGVIRSIQVSDGGVPKLPVEGGVEITTRGVRGDRQRNLKHHGGPDRAVCLYSDELIAGFRDQGHPIDRGTTGENLTISGLDWSAVVEGVRLRVGSLELEITQPANPCRNIAGSFSDGDFTRMSNKLHSGNARMYARVLSPGSIRAGDEVTLSRP
jgi:MOSC domain-containing protein YiiM